MFKSDNAFILLLCACALFLLNTAVGNAQTCWPTPGQLTEGHFENCSFSGSPCPTLTGLSSGGWHVCPGSPSPAPGSGGSTQGLQLIAVPNGYTEGAFTCVRLKANSMYKLTFDIATVAPYNPGEINFYAATGLAPTSTAPANCQDPLPTPTTSLHITTQPAIWSNYQTVTVCFTTDHQSYDQLWMYASFPSGSGQPQANVLVDNITLSEESFDIILDGSTADPVTLCEGPQSDELFLQVVNAQTSSTAEQYAITILQNGWAQGTAILTQSEINQLLGVGLDIKQLNYSPAMPSFTAPDCYGIEVSKKVGDDCYAYAWTTVCIEDCQCDFSGIIDFSPAIGIDGEFYFHIYDAGGAQNNTLLLTADWTFGDGTTGHGLNVVHRYDPGPFTVCATIYAVDKRSGECCQIEMCEDHVQYPASVYSDPDDRPVDMGQQAEFGRRSAAQSHNILTTEALNLRPNPAGTQVTLDYQVSSEDHNISLELYDTKGRLLQTLLTPQTLATGRHELTIPTQELADGVYLVRMNRGGEVVTTMLYVNK